MKQLLVPTDFSIASLHAVDAAVSLNPDCKIHIVLFHMIEMSNDISDLLFNQSCRNAYKMISKDFHQACEVLQNKYQIEIQQISIRIGTGNTSRYLRNFLEGAGIERIVMCQGLKLAKTCKQSVNMLPLLNRCGFPIDLVPYIGSPNLLRPGISVINMSHKNYIINQ